MTAVALQDAIVAALKSAAGVAAAVGSRVYDNPPAMVAYPYISLGPFQALTDDADCIGAEEQFQQVDVWTQEGASKRGCKSICQAVKAALHDAELSLGTGALVLIEVEGWRVIDDPDDSIAHGIVNVRAIIEEA